MKKHNFYFIAECAIVVALLVLIGVLVKDDDRRVQGKESVTAVVEVQEEEKEAGFLQKLMNEQETVSKEDAVEVKDEETEAVVEKENANIKTTAESVSENTTASEEDKVKIVVFGDSIWNAERGENGISEQVMEEMNVEIYNCAIGGTSAAVKNETTNWEDWESRSFNGMMYIATGLISEDELIPNDAACEVIKNVDFNEVDYVIVSYGLNDYFLDVPVYPKEYYDVTSYVGALRNGVRKMQKQYPNIQFILTSPTYCEWFKGERQYELGTYTEAARSVAEELDLHFLDMYHALGKTPDEKTECLEDGVHLTDEGLYLYSRSVIDYLTELGIKTR